MNIYIYIQSRQNEATIFGHSSCFFFLVSFPIIRKVKNNYSKKKKKPVCMGLKGQNKNYIISLLINTDKYIVIEVIWFP